MNRNEPTTHPSLPAVTTAQARPPTPAELAALIAALRDDLAELSVRLDATEQRNDDAARALSIVEQRLDQLESAASRMRAVDSETAAMLVELRAAIEALRLQPADVGQVLGEVSRTLVEVRGAAVRSPWAVALGVGVVSSLVGHVGSCVATRDIAREAAAEAVREVPAASFAPATAAPVGEQAAEASDE